MAEVDGKVMAFVEETLKKNPKIKLEDLFERAKRMSAGIRSLSKRQFNARYPLQVKRRKSLSKRKRSTTRETARPSAPKGPRKGRARATATPRDAVRTVFLQFATDITAAGERKDLVRVLADVDRYVDHVMKAVK